jgi:long-chain acyl-CoA synthetase
LPELKGLRTVLPYFNEKQFQRENVDRLLGAYTLDWRDFMPRLLTYAVDQGFMHRTERTVHEQILTRLSSKTRPVNCFDIVEGKIIPRSADEVRQEILAAAGSLTALGVKPGERVAIVGLNSTTTALNRHRPDRAVSVPLLHQPPVRSTTLKPAAKAASDRRTKIMETWRSRQTCRSLFCRKACPTAQAGNDLLG